jgi:hypothetical protein
MGPASDFSSEPLRVSKVLPAFSEFFQAIMLPSRSTPDLLGGMWSLLQTAQAVPPRLLWDNESGIGRGKLTEPAPTHGTTFDGLFMSSVVPTHSN